jgi:hypothetical protein
MNSKLKLAVFVFFILAFSVLAAIAVRKEMFVDAMTRVLGQTYEAEVKGKTWKEFDFPCKDDKTKTCQGFHFYVALGWQSAEGQAGGAMRVTDKQYDQLREGQSVQIMVYKDNMILK